MNRAKARRVRVEVVAAPGEASGGLARLEILFKEVLQQIPAEQAEEICEAYMKGRVVMVNLAVSRHGSHCKTAFQTSTYEDPRKNGSSDLTPQNKIMAIHVLEPGAGPVN
jgi:hypothetical protein